MIRQQWTAMLAKLTAPMSAPVAAKALADMLPMLDDIPDSAFTLASLEHVASQCERVPTYRELREHLGDWSKAHPPVLPPSRALPAPSSKRDREEEDRQFWNTITPQQLREKTAEIDAMTGPMAVVVRDALRRSYVFGLTRYASHRLGWLPPHWLPREPTEPTPLAAEPETQPRPKPSYLTPEQLATLRKPKAAA
jgi:hypothetical protein